jgi:DnaJ-domain-containing protein 1
MSSKKRIIDSIDEMYEASRKLKEKASDAGEKPKSIIDRMCEELEDNLDKKRVEIQKEFQEFEDTEPIEMNSRVLDEAVDKVLKDFMQGVERMEALLIRSLRNRTEWKRCEN